MNKKRVYGVFLVLFLASMLLLVVVSAAPLANIFDPVKTLFADWKNGNLSVNIAKYVFWGIVGLFIFSLLAFVPFVKGTEQSKVLIRAVLAFLISFLAIAYLTPSDIYTMLASYGALGFVLGAGLPFIILVFFSAEMSKEGAGGKIIAKLVWIVFMIYLFYKIILGMTTTPGIDVIEGSAYIGAIVLCLVYMRWGEEKFLKLIFKEEIRSAVEGQREVDVATVEEEIRMLGVERRSVANSQAIPEARKQAKIASIDKRMERLRKMIYKS